MTMDEASIQMRSQAGALTAVERFLCEFHNADPGATARAFESVRVVRAGASFASTYQSLLGRVAWPTGPATVLDLACGDGFLLSLLAGRADTSLVGVDMSAGELAAAQARLGPRAMLHRAKAQELPLSSGSMDLVLCHLALMLMDEVEQVIAEIRRALKPGAQFCAVIGAPQTRNPVLDAYLAALAVHTPRDEYRGLRFGDRRLGSAPGICEVLGGSFSNILIEDVRIERRCTPAEVWVWFAGMYDLYLLPRQSHDDVQNRFIEKVTPMCSADGRLDYNNALRQFSATAE